MPLGEKKVPRGGDHDTAYQRSKRFFITNDRKMGQIVASVDFIFCL